MRQQVWAAAFAAEYVRQLNLTEPVSELVCWAVADQAAEAYSRAARELNAQLAEAASRSGRIK
jgi:hypothetical protein